MIDLTNQSEVCCFIREQLLRHKQLSLGTVDDLGKPWVVCVNLAYDEKLNFIWKSEMDTLHSKNLMKRPDVAICVYSETAEVGDFGLYAKARAKEVTDAYELKRLLQICYIDRGKPLPALDDFLGGSKTRIYYAEVSEMWLNDDRHLKTRVDLRILRSSQA